MADYSRTTPNSWERSLALPDDPLTDLEQYLADDAVDISPNTEDTNLALTETYIVTFRHGDPWYPGYFLIPAHDIIQAGTIAINFFGYRWSVISGPEFLDDIRARLEREWVYNPDSDTIVDRATLSGGVLEP